MKKYHRKSTRLKNRDYSQNGAYFVTICAHKYQHLFGDIVNNQIRLNKLGKIVCNEWIKTPLIRRNVKLDSFVVMPNHIHGIVVFENGGLCDCNVGAHGRAPLHRNRAFAHNTHGHTPLRRAPKSLGSLIAGFKSVCTKRINEMRNTPRIPIWQRNYHEHIVRDGNDLPREIILNFC